MYVGIFQHIFFTKVYYRHILLKKPTYLYQSKVCEKPYLLNNHMTSRGRIFLFFICLGSNTLCNKRLKKIRRNLTMTISNESLSTLLSSCFERLAYLFSMANWHFLVLTLCRPVCA